MLLVGKYRLFHLLRRNNLLDCSKHLIRDSAACVSVLRLSYLCNDNRLVNFMTLVNRLDHLILRNLIRSRLDHDDLLRGRCNRELQVAGIPYLLGRVHDKLTVYHTHLCRRARTCKRDIGNRRYQRRTDHCHDLRTALCVYGHHHIVDRHIVAVILRE